MDKTRLQKSLFAGDRIFYRKCTVAFVVMQICEVFPFCECIKGLKKRKMHREFFDYF